jgi:carbamoylphosphate synthase large subunit
LEIVYGINSLFSASAEAISIARDRIKLYWNCHSLGISCNNDYICQAFEHIESDAFGIKDNKSL